MSSRIKASGAVGIIPARYGSTRLPGKSLLPLCGHPLIYWVVRNALRARRLERVLLATDDERIAHAVRELDVQAVMTRNDHPSGTDRIAEAARGCGAEIVVNIQGDEPLLDPDLVDRVVGGFSGGAGWDMVTAASPLCDPDMIRKSSVVKVVTDARGGALYFSRSVIPCIRDGDLPIDGIYRRHIGIYGYRAEFLDRMVAEPPCLLERAEKLEQLRALHLGGRILVLDADDSLNGVDTPDDVPAVEAEIRRRWANGA